MKIGHASIVSLLLFTLLAAAADDRVATIGRAKSASAYLYVNIGPRREMASAFCIHPSGIFATCKHVVEAAPGIQKFNLVLCWFSLNWRASARAERTLGSKVAFWEGMGECSE